MDPKLKIGFLFLIVSIAMFMFAVHAFTYVGESSQLFRDIGTICFVGWLPTLIFSVIVIILGLASPEKKN